MPMTDTPSPALSSFLARMREECVVAQAIIRRAGNGFELRHRDDAGLSSDALRLLRIEELRALVQTTETGAYRPLKSAPTLRRGWRAVAAHDDELETALNHLYPGALADGHAVAGANPPVTHYREFTARQTGMYRITAMLDDAQAAAVIKGCCDSKFCLKQRLWTVAGLDGDSVESTSVIPCLEPCAVFLEFARKAARIEQEEKVAMTLGASELETLVAALEGTTATATAALREADFGEATNGRRAQLLLEKLKALKVARPDTVGH